MSIIDHIIALVETKVELAKIEVRDELSFIISRVLIGLFLGLLLGFGWLFLFLAISFKINCALDTHYLGILIVAGLHLMLFLLIYFFRGKLGIQWLIGQLVHKMFERKE